jgi:hypothetical protein
MEPPSVQSPFAHSRCCRELGRHELPPERTLLLRLSSYGLMRQSRRLSSPSAIASCEESTQVATSPCCQRNLLDVILRIFPWLPGPLPRRSHRVHAPVDFPDVIGLPPRKDGLASRFIPRTRLFVGEFSRLQTFRYVQAPKFVCLPDRSHRYGNAKGRPRLLHPGRTCFVASARTGYASRPKQAIDGTRTCTLLDPQHCRPLPFPPHSPPTIFCLCSNDSSVLYRRVTPRGRTCGPCGYCLRPPPCYLVWQQVSPRSPGSRA